MEAEKASKQKTRKVYYYTRGSLFLPMIRLQGKYLTEFGFEIGDTIEVTTSENSITIIKHPKTA